MVIDSRTDSKDAENYSRALRYLVTSSRLALTVWNPNVRQSICSALKEECGGAAALQIARRVSLQSLHTYIRLLHRTFTRFVHNGGASRTSTRKGSIHLADFDIDQVFEAVHFVRDLDINRNKHHALTLHVLLEAHSHATLYLMLSLSASQISTEYRRRVDQLRSFFPGEAFSDIRNEVIDTIKDVVRLIMKKDLKTANLLVCDFAVRYPISRLCSKFIMLMDAASEQLGPLPREAERKISRQNGHSFKTKRPSHFKRNAMGDSVPEFFSDAEDVCNVAHETGPNHARLQHGRTAVRLSMSETSSHETPRVRGISKEKSARYSDRNRLGSNSAVKRNIILDLDPPVDVSDEERNESDEHESIRTESVYRGIGHLTSDEFHDFQTHSPVEERINSRSGSSKKKRRLDRNFDIESTGIEKEDVAVHRKRSRSSRKKHQNSAMRSERDRQVDDISDGPSNGIGGFTTRGDGPQHANHMFDGQEEGSKELRTGDDDAHRARTLSDGLDKGIGELSAIRYGKHPASSRKFRRKAGGSYRSRLGDSSNASDLEEPSKRWKRRELSDDEKLMEDDPTRSSNGKFKKGRMTLRELRDASVSLNANPVEDPLESSLHDATRARRHSRRLVRDLDRPANNARDASPIPDTESSLTRRRRETNIRLPDDDQSSDDFVDDVRDVDNAHEKLYRKGRFTREEDEWLIAGLDKYGWGSWAIISRHFGGSLGANTRSGVSLKDRARTLNLDPEKYMRPNGRLERRGRHGRITPKKDNNAVDGTDEYSGENNQQQSENEE